MRLADYLSDHDLSQQALADRANLHVNSIIKYLRGTMSPGLLAIRAIEVATHGEVTYADWVEGVEG